MDPYEGGRLDSSGAFTVDVTKAKLKLAHYYLPPGLFQLRLIQAGVAAGCTHLEIHGRRKIVYFGGKFELGALAQGLQEPLSLPKGTPEAYLAEGILASGSTPDWRSDTGTIRGTQCESTPQKGPPRATVTLTTHLDQALLQKHCEHCPIPIGGDMLISRAHDRCLVDEDGIRIPASLTGPAQILWMEAGVVIATETLPWACRGARILAAPPQTDITGLQVIRTEEHVRELRQKLHEHVKNLLAQPLKPTHQGHSAGDYAVGATITVMSMAAGTAMLVPPLAPTLFVGAILLGPIAGLWAGKHTRDRVQQQELARIKSILEAAHEQADLAGP